MNDFIREKWHHYKMPKEINDNYRIKGFLNDESEVTLLFESSEEGEKDIEITFHHGVVYFGFTKTMNRIKTIHNLEEIFGEKHMSEWYYEVTHSKKLEELHDDSYQVLKHVRGNLRHFVFRNEQFMYEVISDSEPEVKP